MGLVLNTFIWLCGTLGYGCAVVIIDYKFYAQSSRNFWLNVLYHLARIFWPI